MEIYVRDPSNGVYETDGDWVHTIEVRGAERTVYVSGTMGLDADGSPGASLEEQLDLLWSNIRTILGSAEMTVDNVVRVTSYLRDASYAQANAAARVAALAGRAVATTAIVAETLVSEWLVEIEVIAAALGDDLARCSPQHRPSPTGTNALTSTLAGFSWLNEGLYLVRDEEVARGRGRLRIASSAPASGELGQIVDNLVDPAAHRVS